MNGERGELWRPGDLLGFCGRNLTSLGVQLGTCSLLSHVAGLAWISADHLRAAKRVSNVRIPAGRIDSWHPQWVLFESTTLNNEPCEIMCVPIDGVQAHRPCARVRAYNGSVYRYRLHESWREHLEARETELAQRLLSRLGERYDLPGALLSGSRVLKHWWAWRRVDRSSLFCSELWAWVLQHVGLFPITNSSKWNPKMLLRSLVEAEVYLPGELIHRGNRRSCWQLPLAPFTDRP